MIKEFLIKKMLKAKGVPAEQIDPLLEIINKNPALFQTIASEVDAKMKQGGMDQTAATMAVLQKYQTELRQIFPK